MNNLSTNKKDYFIYACTHKGNVREHNEDYFSANTLVRQDNDEPQSLESPIPEPSLIGVFDGMGGEKDGSAASRISAKITAEYFEYLKINNDIHKSIDSYVYNCNKVIKEYMAEHKLKRCGSTFALVYLSGKTAYCFSMGDSRIYLFREGSLVQISTDHTLANKKYKANIYTKKEAEESPDSHILTAYLGANNDAENTLAEAYNPIELQWNDKILICSDGLYDMCDNQTITRIMGKEGNTAKKLVGAALKNGGEDNITCVVLELI